MIKYIIKRKVKNEMLENRKKIAFYIGLAAASTAGAYLSYKVIKKIRNKNEIQYLEYEEDELNDFNDQLNNDELKEKVDEFNSRRICCENCEDVSPEEMTKYINSIEDDKKNVEINENEYETEEYENYEEDMQK